MRCRYVPLPFFLIPAYIWHARSQNERGNKTREYKFRRGTTAFTKEQIKSLIVKEEVKILPTSLAATTAMDVA